MKSKAEDSPKYSCGDQLSWAPHPGGRPSKDRAERGRWLNEEGLLAMSWAGSPPSSRALAGAAVAGRGAGKRSASGTTWAPRASGPGLAVARGCSSAKGVSA
ncbi:hypothetical protein VTK73DRAFT_4116 [Phialemonium thermophilum]|uniref:Uncharacterized protein n=1 Tax=Phialemonium thermophilum TaxID=223376 RepID=A0ABR3VBS4_9PEZI